MTDQDRREALANDAAWQSGYARGRADCARERDELRTENDRLRTAIGGFRWVGNNLHNQATPQFRTYYEAALEDAREAMGDDWQPMGLPTRAALHSKDGAS